jgi:hypothetical protein
VSGERARRPSAPAARVRPRRARLRRSGQASAAADRVAPRSRIKGSALGPPGLLSRRPCRVVVAQQSLSSFQFNSWKISFDSDLTSYSDSDFKGTQGSDARGRREKRQYSTSRAGAPPAARGWISDERWPAARQEESWGEETYWISVGGERRRAAAEAWEHGRPTTTYGGGASARIRLPAAGATRNKSLS